MTTTARVGHGITITFGTQNFTGELTSVARQGIERLEFEATHMTSAEREFVFDEIIAEGTIDIELNYDTDNELMAGPPEEVTIQMPAKAGQTTGAKYVGQAAVTNIGWTAPVSDRMVSTATLRWAGQVQKTAAVPSP